MRFIASVALLAVVAVAAVSAQSSTTTKFDVLQCYQDDPSTWMPNTLDNLIAIIEKLESNSMSNIDEMAEMLLTRYRKDGIVYRPESGQSDWSVDETFKVDKKQALIELITRPTTQPPVDTFDIREECALHRMLSHSTDDYPVAGIDETWETPLLTSSSNRGKRSLFSTGGLSSSVSVSAEALRSGAAQYTAAVHPIERGVIETPYGPIAAGTLMAGIMSITNSPGSSIQNVLGTEDSKNMPSEMKTRTLIPVYAATLAGDLGELALWTRDSKLVGTPTVGPLGRFHNCTTCSQLFSLQNNLVSFLSRAELFAGIDALVLTAAYANNGASGSNSLKLSQLLDLYYSDKGLPGMPDIKACNRLNLYQSVTDRTQLMQQALSFMYAFTFDFPDQEYYIEQRIDDYPTIEQEFTVYINQAVQAMESFISSYSYDDESASRCFFSGSGNGWSSGASSIQVPQSEGSADLVAVYAEEGTVEYMEKERQMIADVARRLGVSTTRSRLGVLRAQDATWIQELQNISNIADWGCNFTTNTDYQSGGSNRGDLFTVVLAELTSYYDQVYRVAFNDMQSSSGRSHVVVWQVPASMPGDLTTNKKAVRNFRLRFPDVSLIFVGRNEAPYLELLDDKDDFISFSNKNMQTLTSETVNRIQSSPRPFMYPACDPDNSTTANNYNENSHTYEGAVSPNMTTYIRIPPQAFHYSEELILQVQGKVRACFSRTNRFALEDFTVENLDDQRDALPDDQIMCTGGPDDAQDKVTYKWLCDRYVKTCSPVYISVTGLDSSVRASCNSDMDPECEYPNQIQFTLNHQGMICGASCNTPALLLLLLPALLQYFMR